VDIYEGIDLKVRLEEVKPEEVEQCIKCLWESGEMIYRVHARRKLESQE